MPTQWLLIPYPPTKASALLCGTNHDFTTQNYLTTAGTVTKSENKLQKAIRHARRAPDVKVARIAALYEVNATTLRRRLAGKTQNYTTPFRDRQLFTVGEEKAIAVHVGEMADYGFPLNHMLPL